MLSMAFLEKKYPEKPDVLLYGESSLNKASKTHILEAVPGFSVESKRLTFGNLWKSKTRVASSNPRVRRLKARVAGLKARVGRLKARVTRLKDELKQ